MAAESYEKQPSGAPRALRLPHKGHKHFSVCHSLLSKLPNIPLLCPYRCDSQIRSCQDHDREYGVVKRGGWRRGEKREKQIEGNFARIMRAQQSRKVGKAREAVGLGRGAELIEVAMHAVLHELSTQSSESQQVSGYAKWLGGAMGGRERLDDQGQMDAKIEQETHVVVPNPHVTAGFSEEGATLEETPDILEVGQGACGEQAWVEEQRWHVAEGQDGQEQHGPRVEQAQREQIEVVEVGVRHAYAGQAVKDAREGRHGSARGRRLGARGAGAVVQKARAEVGDGQQQDDLRRAQISRLSCRSLAWSGGIQMQRGHRGRTGRRRGRVRRWWQRRLRGSLRRDEDGEAAKVDAIEGDGRTIETRGRYRCQPQAKATTWDDRCTT